MKKIFILSFSILFSCFILNSCDPWEDDSYHEGTNPGENVEITGDWKLSAIILEESYDFNGDGTTNTDLMVETECYQNELMNFAEDNTGIATSNSYADITIDGETFTIECIEEIEETPFAWVQNENTILITIDNYMVLNAVLAGNTLTYVIPEGFMVGGPDGDVEILQDMTFIYTKQ